ncbi:MAG: hypothetical protein HRU38_14985 [Saccharospirillaceae bacterium]|nr:hypothetical protein [Pseudomonadales bacterium]NRB79946.1 hypothetical protein [Saccharospirillaceae bacterium]
MKFQIIGLIILMTLSACQSQSTIKAEKLNYDVIIYDHYANMKTIKLYNEKQLTPDDIATLNVGIMPDNKKQINSRIHKIIKSKDTIITAMKKIQLINGKKHINDEGEFSEYFDQFSVLIPAGNTIIRYEYFRKLAERNRTNLNLEAGHIYYLIMAQYNIKVVEKELDYVDGYLTHSTVRSFLYDRTTDKLIQFDKSKVKAGKYLLTY